MRTLYEIAEDAKDGNMPSREECYWAMLCFIVLLNSDHTKLIETLLSDKPSPEFIRKMKADNSYNAYRTALNKSPKDYLGPNWDPSNPEYQRFRKIGNKIVNKFIKPSK
jgi:hypothetical protein